MSLYTGLRVSLIFQNRDDMRAFAEYIIGYIFYTYVLMFCYVCHLLMPHNGDGLGPPPQRDTLMSNSSRDPPLRKM